MTVVGVSKNFRDRYFNNLNYDVYWNEKLSQKQILNYLGVVNYFVCLQILKLLGLLTLRLLHLLAVISTDVGGIPEALNGYKNVKLIKPNDPIQLGKSINDFFSVDYSKDQKYLKKLKNHHIRMFF